MTPDEQIREWEKKGIVVTVGKSANFALQPAGATVDLSPPPEGCTEEVFRNHLNKLAKALGWDHYHTNDSRRSPIGFPDETYARDFGPVPMFVAELKVPPNKPSAAQTKWLNHFRRAGIPAFLWYPHDWDAILKVLE